MIADPSATLEINVPILMYHHLELGSRTNEPYTVSKTHFENQLEFLQGHGFTSITFVDLFKVVAGHATAPVRPVVLTFDDAYLSFLEIALPMLVRRKMKATVFVVAGEIGGFNQWDAERNIPKRQLMDEEGFLVAIEAGMEIGSHGWGHRNLCECSQTDLRKEIFRSRLELERRLGPAPEVFSYPYGAHNPVHYPLLRDAGYLGAVSIFSDAPTVTSNMFAMRRAYIHSGDGNLRFRLKLSAIYMRYVAWRDRNYGHLKYVESGLKT